EQKQSPLSITQSMRVGVEREQHLAITKTPQLPQPHTAAIVHSAKLNGTYYIFSKNRGELRTPQNNTHTGEFGNGIKIALIVPTFTQAAYNNAFYKFYEKYANVPYGRNITADLNLLSSKVLPIDLPSSRSAFAMLQLVGNLKWITQKSNITVLTDADVDNGSIFAKNGDNNNNNAYDVIILGHQEYVTQKEYDNLRKFVTNVGTMIILDGNVFYAQVKYDRSNQTVTLVKGHWWAFNGKSAWKSVGERWRNETSKWVGSNYLCYRCINKFTNDPFGYTPHEEQYITNPHDIILLNYDASLRKSVLKSKPVIASYELNYQRGRVIALGIYSEDVLSNGKFDRYLDSLLVQYDIKIRD
ncbi:MAG TPA: N,N-dimethylformamidase beta subunit family domain-containing protein, partial [Nitrososphaeraceae archaeon]|nr:N,N-dimethylformamidase beta subunit family domain-containing protein [Nitrososphaeraceae archaeon]